MMTMTQIEYTLADLIKFSSEQKPLEFGSAFNALIAGKVESAIDAKKIEVAQRMFASGEQDTEAGEEEDGEAA